MSMRLILLAGLLACSLFPGCSKKQTAPDAPPAQVRMGYFANITHAQALIGVGRGDFQKALGGIKLETRVFNAGPSVVEALFAGELDISYVGPAPAVNAYVKSNGKAVRVIAGAAANGASIVVRTNSGIEKMEDLAGKRIATPQFGNTQDVSARIYIAEMLKAPIGDQAGATRIIPVANAEQIALFGRGEIDAAWSPEPWASRLVYEAGGKRIAEEKDMWAEKRFTVTLLMVSAQFLQKHPAQVEAILRAHADLTAWINANRESASALVNQQLASISGKGLKPEVLSDAFARVEFTTDPLPYTFSTFAKWSHRAGMLKTEPDVAGLVDRSMLDILSGASR